MTESGRKGPGRQAVSISTIEAAERHARWMKLRLAGKSYREIADLEGVSKTAVHEACIRRLRDVTAEPAEELIALELERLDTLLSAVFENALDPTRDDQLDWHEQARKILSDRRRMLGMEAPKQLVLTAGGEERNEKARELLLSPTGAFRDVLMEALRNPGPEWQLMLAEAGYHRRQTVLETSGEDLTGQENRSQVSRLASIIGDMLDGNDETK